MTVGESRGAPQGPWLSREQAESVWKRAAELQQRSAEAAARAERGSSSAVEVRDDAVSSTELVAIGREVGIDEHHVISALRELETGRLPAPARRPQPFLTFLLGTDVRTLERSRTVPGPADLVLKVLGRVFAAAPFLLEMRIGPLVHPLDGGVLYYAVPAMSGDNANYAFGFLRYGVGASVLEISLRPLDDKRTRVTVRAELDGGRVSNLVGLGIIGTSLGLTTVLVALNPLGALAAAGLAAVSVSLTSVGWGPFYRWCLRHAEREVDRLLAAIDAGLYAVAVFGELPVPGDAAGPGERVTP